MTAAVIVAAAAGLTAGGAWARWGTVPVRAAYAAGRIVGRMQGRRQP